MAIHFGLVSVPVGVYKAVDDHDLKFGFYHAGCNGAVGNVRTCKECGEEVAWGDIAKGAESEAGVLVVADPEEIKSLEGEQVPGIEVIQFCEAGEIDPLRFENPYYLSPDKTGVDGYSLLRHVLAESGKVGLVRFALRGRESLGVLRPVGDVLVMHTICWADEVRDTGELPNMSKPAKLKPQMIQMAHVLVDGMTAPFDPDAHADVHTARLREFVEAKAAGGELEFHKPEPEPAVDDLLAALEATIAKNKKKKGKAA
jgi:DNA end-binding protein Ku